MSMRIYAFGIFTTVVGSTLETDDSRRDDLITHLCEKDWTLDELDELKKYMARKIAIGDIKGLNVAEVKALVEQRELELSRNEKSTMCEHLSDEQ